MKTNGINHTVWDEAKTRTTKCPHDFSCLTSGKCGNLALCEILRRFDHNMLYVKTTEDKASALCPYKMVYGSRDEHICTCPLHYVIYFHGKARQCSGK
jgi:hypothetical protein